MSPPAIAFAAVTCLVAAVLAGPEGADAAAVILAGATALGAVGYAGVRRRRRLGGLHRQFGWIIAGCAAAAVLAAFVAAAGIPDPARSTLALAALLLWVVAGVSAVSCALARCVALDVDRIARGLMAVGAGDPRVVLSVPGDDETGALAVAANRMIEQLRTREFERDEAQRTRQALVRAMVNQLLERTAEQEAAEAQRRERAAAASHDVRTPLTSLRLLAEALRDGLVDSDEVAAHASSMLQHLAVMHRLTEQVFELARIEAGDIAWEMVEADLGELLRDTADQLEVRAAEGGLSVVVEIDARVGAVMVAPGMVMRVVVNLVQNAIEHTPGGGRVRLSARPGQGAFVEIEVSDTGGGIAASDRARIFEPFFRGDLARSGAGTGLGLSIARGIVEAHGGRIWLAEADAGTCIRFTLPAADAARSREPEDLADRRSG